MSGPPNLSAVVLLVAATLPLQANAQATAEATAPYNLTVSVNEVSLTFHAADLHGLPLDDLRLGELKILNNGKPPRRMVFFGLMQDDPLRAGLLLDTSESMQSQLAANRAISLRYAQRLVHRKIDEAFVMDFGYVSKIVQSWTHDPAVLASGIRQVVAGSENPLAGTALFDTVFRACFNLFGTTNSASNGNFILLFSDGEDNASHTSLPEVVDICQRANTAIYAFRGEPNPSLFSSGPKTLADLASQTGGRVSPAEDEDPAIDRDLQTIEADLRSQYRLVYNPIELKHDGAFHRIELTAPERVGSLRIRSGYYDQPR